MSVTQNNNDTTAPLIDVGDVGFIIKPDGSFKMFAANAAEGSKKKLIALALALVYPQAMYILEDLVKQTGFADELAKEISQIESNDT